jgi:hypothetical protein
MFVGSSSSAFETSPIVLARAVGLLNLVVLASGTFAGSVSARLVVPGDAAATARNITASELLFRLGFVSGLLMYLIFVFSVWLLYRLLASVDEPLARLMVMLVLVGVSIAMLNQVHQSAALILLSGVDYLKAFNADQIQGQVMFFLDLHKQGGLVGAIFWGLWLFPLGLLVFRSGFFPRILGVLLMLGSLGWLLVPLQRFLLPGYEALAYSRFAAHVAEMSWTLWLLIRGLNVERWPYRSG